jgi:hypothetical protein
MEDHLKPPEGQKKSRMSSMSGFASQIKKKRGEPFWNPVNPYGMEEPYQKLRTNFYEEENVKSRCIRPVSSTENLRYRSRDSDRSK